MYYIKKTMEISAAHSLRLDYESKCQMPHGHNWFITVYCKSQNLNHNGMVIDFNEIKSKVHDVLDHNNINTVTDIGNPTAENIAKWVCDQLQPYCYKVEVEETKNNIATYEK